MMKHLLLLLPPMLGLACATARAQTTGDFLFSKVGVDGSIEVYITPNSTDLLGWNGSGAMTQIPRSTWLTPATAAATYEPILSAGTTGQFYRGDKTWQTLNATAVGLGNVSNALQLVAANNLSDLASASTARTNLGLGAAALLGTSSTGSAGSVAVYGLFGSLSAVGSITASASIGSNTGAITSNGFTFSDGTYSLTVGRATLTANRQIDWPNVSGDLITTGDTGTVTNTMLAGSIALSKLSITGTPDGTKYLRDDGTWQTVSTGLTINTTTTSGASAGDILTSDGTLLQKLTPGTGVTTALGNAVNAASGLLTYSLIGTSGTKIPLLDAANTFGAAQVVNMGAADSFKVQYLASDRFKITTTATAGNIWFGDASYFSHETSNGAWIMKYGGSERGRIIFAENAYNIELKTATTGDFGVLIANTSYNGAYLASDLRLNNTVGVFKIEANPRQAVGAYTGPGHTLALIGGQAQTTSTGGAGGLISITGGAAGGSGNNNGGNVTIQGGAPTGSGVVGTVTFGSGGSGLNSIKRSSVTLVAGTATVSDTATTANTVVLMSVITPGGTVGTLDYDVSAGSSYTINSSSATDTSTINITVIHFP